MGVARRIAELYEVKVNALLDRVEDPREMLDYSYAQQQAMLRKLKQQTAEVAASRLLAQAQEAQLQGSADRLAEQAEQAVAAGQEELARQALAWRSAILAHVDDLRAEQVALQEDEERLAACTRRLQLKIEAFGLRKETIKAGYTAAKASASVSRVVGGASEELGDVALATRRAQEATARLQARAEALTGVLASPGPGGPPAGPTPDQIQAQLDAVTTKAVVEEELARIKARLAEREPAGRAPATSAQGKRAAAQRERAAGAPAASARGKRAPGPPPATPAGASPGESGPGGAP